MEETHLSHASNQVPTYGFDKAVEREAACPDSMSEGQAA